MAIVSATVTDSDQGTTGTQFIGPIVVSVHGLRDGVVLLQRSPDNSIWYDMATITDDVETNSYAPGDTLQDYYRLWVISKPTVGDIVLRIGN